MITTFRFDANIRKTSTLRLEKIEEENLPLIRRLKLLNWSGTKEDEASLIKSGKWIANADKTIVFHDAGGGSFEIPEMYDLFYSGLRVRLECGGGGLPCKWFGNLDKSDRKLTILVTKLDVPPELSSEHHALLALLAEAFAVRYMSPPNSSLEVQFRMFDLLKDWPGDGVLNFNDED